MFHPCNSKNQFTLFSKNLPAYQGSRYSVPYENTTTISYIKYKLLLNKHLNIYNGPGIVNPTFNKKYDYNLKYSIQINNIIYVIPCILIPYIQQLRDLINQNYTIDDAIQKLISLYSELAILNSPLPNNKRLYKYPNVNVRNNPLNVGSFSKPFKIGNPISKPNPALSWNTIFNLPLQYDGIFFITDDCRYIQVSNNDAITFTTNMNDLLPNGSASFWGEKLLYKNAYTQHPNGSYTINPNFILPVIIISITVQSISYGYLLNIIDYPVFGIYENKLLFVPLHTLLSLITQEPYITDTPINIKTNVNLSFIQSYFAKQISCKVRREYNLFKNTFT
jgi:hypothetical protein